MSEAWQQLMGNNIELDPEDRMESQHFQLCAVHAINHLLQEEKVIWEPRIPTMYISSSENVNYVNNAPHAWTCACNHTNPSNEESCAACHTAQPAHRNNDRLGHAYNISGANVSDDAKDPMDYDTLINIHKYCANKLLDLQATQKEPGKNTLPEPETLLNTFPESVCQFTGGHQGMIPFDFIGDILERTLHHTVIRPKTIDNDVIIDAVQEDDTLGVLLNLGGGHYTTICKYFKSCIVDDERKYAYIDSIYNDNEGGVNCVTAAELNQLLTDIAAFGQTVYAVLVVKSTADSYESKAKTRQESGEFNVSAPENNINHNSAKNKQKAAAAAAFNGGTRRNKTRKFARSSSSSKRKTPSKGGKRKTPCSGVKPKTRRKQN